MKIIRHTHGFQIGLIKPIQTSKNEIPRIVAQFVRLLRVLCVGQIAVAPSRCRVNMRSPVGLGEGGKINLFQPINDINDGLNSDDFSRVIKFQKFTPTQAQGHVARGDDI